MTVTKALPQGSLVLVTGVNGYVASHVADQLLEHGYAVRGTARDETKLNQALDVLRKRHPNSDIEGIVVKDMTADGAFDEAMAPTTKPVSGVAHVASDVSFGPDPNVVVKGAIAGVTNALRAAAKTPSVKRVVYTSSSIAVSHPGSGKVVHLDASTWNEEDIELVRADANRDIKNWTFHVYGASKAESERAAWNFVKENKPGFVFNAVNPNTVFGPILYGGGSTAGWVKALCEGDSGDAIQSLPPSYMVHVRDVALLHLAALLEPDVQGERLLGYSEPYNFASLVETLKKIVPSKKFPEVPSGPQPKDLSIVDTRRAAELLKRYGRASGFDGLEATLRDQIAHM